MNIVSEATDELETSSSDSNPLKFNKPGLALIFDWAITIGVDGCQLNLSVTAAPDLPVPNALIFISYQQVDLLIIQSNLYANLFNLTKT